MYDFLDKTTKQLFETNLTFLNNFPKNESEIKKVLEKIQTIFKDEFQNSKTMWEIYNKSLKGNATINELNEANKMYQELLSSTRFAFILLIPGSIFALPMLIKFADSFGIDLVPESVARQFKF